MALILDTSLILWRNMLEQNVSSYAVSLISDAKVVIIIDMGKFSHENLPIL